MIALLPLPQLEVPKDVAMPSFIPIVVSSLLDEKR